jgi:hypothetical protein
MQRLQSHPVGTSITWEPKTRLAERTSREGHFAAITDVPPAARQATVRLIEPSGGTDRLWRQRALFDRAIVDSFSRFAAL